MLVLNRKLHGEIILGTGPSRIRVKILGIQKGQVSLGIDAPRDTPVWRAELVGKVDALPSDELPGLVTRLLSLRAEMAGLQHVLDCIGYDVADELIGRISIPKCVTEPTVAE